MEKTMLGNRLKYSIILLTLLLSGCISVRTPIPTSQRFHYIPFRIRQAKLNKIQSWRIQGAFSMQPKNQKPVIASYSWQQKGKSDATIRISSTLDLYSILIERRPGYAILWKNDKQSYRAKNTERLMQKVLGWSLPVTDLMYWVRGLPAPGKSKINIDKFGHAREISQQGWQVRYGSYQDYAGNDFPRVIYLSYPGLNIKIVIRSWIL